jgi:hypothetical protein
MTAYWSVADAAAVKGMPDELPAPFMTHLSQNRPLHIAAARGPFNSLT